MIPMPRLLNASLGEERRIRPIQVSISESITPLTTASMTLARGDMITDRSFVELFTINGSAGVFRVRQPQIGYGGQNSTLSLESALCEIGDYIVGEKADQTEGPLVAAVGNVFNYYGGSKWQLGTVANGTVIYSLNYDNILSCINGLVAQCPQLMISCDYTTTPWTLNIVSRGAQVSAEGRLSRNVRGAVIRRDDSELCTKVWMEGLGTDGAVGYMTASTISTYGLIERKIDGSGYTAAQAQSVAESYLDIHKNPKYSISVEAADFSSLTGETLDRIAIGKKYRLTIPEDNVTIEEHIVKMDWSDVYGSPESVTITLADEEKTLVSFIKKNQSAAEQAQSSADSAYSYADSVSGSVSTLSQTVTSNDGLYWSKFEQTDRAIAAEVTRATNAEGTKIAKTQDIQTVTDLLGSAAQTAQGYATSAKEACIAKTQVYQTADAIVTSAVAYSGADAATKYIAMTNTYQTADAIVNEAVRVSGVNATNDFIKKSGTYTTVDSLLTKAQQDAEAAATTAASGCIAKTSTYQSASAIVNSAVATAAYDASQTYIAQTTTYQTADAIVSTAKTYTDGKVASQASTIEQLSDKISLVVTRVGNQDEIDVASIVAAVNDAGSSIQISADHIDLQGHVSVSDMSEYNALTNALDVNGNISCDALVVGTVYYASTASGWISCDTLAANDIIYNGDTVSTATINGYTVLVVV